MTTAYATTSVPGWAVTGSADDLAPPDPRAQSWILIELTGAASALRDWAGRSPLHNSATIAGARAQDVQQSLAVALSTARVGVRAVVAGPAGDCLIVRGQLLSAGLEEDEVIVIPTAIDEIEVYCTHCQHPTRTLATIGETTPCEHCGRSLYIYHHVSRLTGQYMGFQADAETLPAELPA